MGAKMLKYEYTDKKACKKKVLQIANNKLLKGAAVTNLEGLFTEIDNMQPGESRSWVINIIFVDSFSDSCEIVLTLPNSLSSTGKRKQEVNK